MRITSDARGSRATSRERRNAAHRMQMTGGGGKERARFMSGLGGQGRALSPLQGLQYRTLKVAEDKSSSFPPLGAFSCRMMSDQVSSLVNGTVPPHCTPLSGTQLKSCPLRRLPCKIPPPPLLPTSIGVVVVGGAGVKLERDDASSEERGEKREHLRN